MAFVNQSQDGVTWTAVPINLTPSNSFIKNLVDTGTVIGIETIGNHVIAVTDNGVILSRSGINSFPLSSIDTVYNPPSSTRLSNVKSMIKLGGTLFIASGSTLVSMNTGLSPAQVNLSWIQQTSNFGANSINDILFNSGTWVAAGGGGIIRTSDYPNSFVWTTRTSNITSAINSLVFGSGRYVVGGSAGEIRTSLDLATWTTQTSNMTSINRIAYGNGRWVAVGNVGALRASTDSANWTTPTSNFAANANINHVAYGNGLWTAVGDGNQIRTSTDTVTWTTRTGNFTQQVTNTITQIAYNNGMWMMGSSSGLVRTSTDGVSWTGEFNSGLPVNLLAGNGTGRWFVTHKGFSTPRIASYSDNNGVTWASVGWSTRASGSSINAFIFSGGGGYAGLADGRMRFWGGGATNWSTMNGNHFGFGAITAMGYHNTTPIAGGAAGRITATTAWTLRTSNLTTQINCIASNTAVVVAAGASGQMRQSTDTVTWTTLTSPTTNNIYALAYGNGRWIMLDGASIMRSSTNLSTWTTENPNFGTSSINTIAYGNGNWAIGSSAEVAARWSTNGVTWTTRGQDTLSLNITAVGYGHGLWVLGGRTDGLIVTTTDFNTWTTATTLGTIARHFTFTNGRLFAAGNTGSVFIESTDGITWTNPGVSLEASSTVGSIAYGNNLWGVGANNGQITMSTRQTANINFVLDKNQTRQVALSNNGLIFTYEASTGRWHPRYTAINDNFIKGRIDENNIYTISGQNAVYRTTDLFTWTTFTGLNPASFNDIIVK